MVYGNNHNFQRFRLPSHSAKLHDRRPTQHRRQPVRLADRLLLRRHPRRDEGGEARAPEPGGHWPTCPEGPGQPVGSDASEKIRPDQVKRPRMLVNHPTYWRPRPVTSSFNSEAASRSCCVAVKQRHWKSASRSTNTSNHRNVSVTLTASHWPSVLINCKIGFSCFNNVNLR